ncbi:MAG TPA: VIT1/CCC1 transporter family protein, partial [Hyphomicrobiales bacterium]|nr:VIT1/CCC1 transporter family protein [Hyphomicrobiales bacterium]
MNVIQHRHRLHRSNWLRAAVLGANDGIVSTAALLIGVATAGSDKSTILLAGAAALVAGAMSMAAGEYVSVSSQADTEAADLALEQQSLETMPQQEQQELADIYVRRGLEPTLAQEVARQLMAHDALAAHARDDIGITEISQARPLAA